jgi:hypothetical protein
VNWLLIIIGILLFLFILIAITKLTVLVDLHHAGDDDHIIIKFLAWFGIIRYTIKIPLIKIDKESPGIVVKHEEIAGNQTEKSNKGKNKFTPKDILLSIEDTTKIIQHVVNIHKIVQQFLSRVSISKFNWNTTLGIGDAAQTGLIVGLGWTLKGTLIGVVSQYMQLKVHPTISITPSFQIPISETKLSCIFHFRIGHAILAGIRLVKYWKGGLPKFKTKPLSMLSGNQNKSV